MRRTILAAFLAVCAVIIPGGTAVAQDAPAPRPPVWTVPQISALPNDQYGKLVRQGRDLIDATYAHIGPLAADPAKRFAGNNLACSDCHLRAGTKMFGLPIFGLFGKYPLYSARSGAEITIRDLDRAADPERGRQVYARSCATCHNAEGSGFRRSFPRANPGYAIPPLWGSDSFNDGAGMSRLITAANFIRANMPAGTDYLAPQLSDADAWDVAAFVVSQPRPHKADLAKDFPDRLDKPVDVPYGPYADGFGEQQHKYGPFAPIREAVTRLKAERPAR